MTPEEWAAFLQVHKDLPREGPGLPDDVRWAVERIGLSGEVDVFDAACGPGDDTVTLGARFAPCAHHGRRYHGFFCRAGTGARGSVWPEGACCGG